MAENKLKELRDKLPVGSYKKIAEKCNCSYELTASVMAGRRTDHKNIIPTAMKIAAKLNADSLKLEEQWKTITS